MLNYTVQLNQTIVKVILSMHEPVLTRTDIPRRPRTSPRNDEFRGRFAPNNRMPAPRCAGKAALQMPRQQPRAPSTILLPFNTFL